MSAAGDISGNRHIVRLVRQDKPGERIALHKTLQDLLIGRIAASDPMAAESERVFKPGNGRDGRVRRKWTLFYRIFVAGKENLIDLAERKAGDLDWRPRDDQLLEFNFEFVEIPLPLFRQAIERQTQQPLLIFA